MVYFCYGWTLWLYLNWLPSYFLHEYPYDLQSRRCSRRRSSSRRCGDYLGGVISDRILHRTGDLQKARRNVVMIGFVGSFVCLLPVFLTHDLVLIILSLGGAFFFAELVIGPMWSIPMDIAGKFSGNRCRHDEQRIGAPAILSPVAFGVIIDSTGNWQLPFVGSLAFCSSAPRSRRPMHPERAFEEGGASSGIG